MKSASETTLAVCIMLGVWTEQGLVPSHGPLLIPQDLGLKWDLKSEFFWVDDQAWPLSEAIQASAQWVGRLARIDQVDF